MYDIITQDVLFFFDGRPFELALYERLAGEIQARFPGATVSVHKTQISFYDPRLFACVSFAPVRRAAERPARFITVTFGLDAPLAHPRAIAVPVRPNRFTHHVVVGRVDEINSELMGWIEQSHGISTRKDH